MTNPEHQVESVIVDFSLTLPTGEIGDRALEVIRGVQALALEAAGLSEEIPLVEYPASVTGRSRA